MTPIDAGLAKEGLLKKQIASWLDCSQGPWRRQLLGTVIQ
jgi:hypothetical protein